MEMVIDDKIGVGKMELKAEKKKRSELVPDYCERKLQIGILEFERETEKLDAAEMIVELSQSIKCKLDSDELNNSKLSINKGHLEAVTEIAVGIFNGDINLKGKAACTKFTRISTSGTHSIVLCEPITDRTHQVRVHLQSTCYPIAKDMLYLSDVVVDRFTLGMTSDRAAALSGSSPSTSCENENEEYNCHSRRFQH